MNKLNEKDFLHEVCQHLDASVAHLDPRISESLDKARHFALSSCATLAASEQNLFTHNLHQQLNNIPEVSPDIKVKLDHIRQQAMARLDSAPQQIAPTLHNRLLSWLKSQFSGLSLGVPTSMLATACVLVTVVSVFYVNSRPTGSLSLEEEISLIASAEDIELYENLEFYLWLAESEPYSL
ncbi:MAG: hypothetical protein COA96_17445 [SAR86 cluster bacterium]|uniref:DUF3619 domain-containing protein n=1 Tax=SAR86 cluster bacterium TaxID=2030880 RepID=A0A2A5AEN5_9GAMM|nr:MAG: hypothetical protein COA96_17445 [SAR86 cluster bacterium]